MINFELPQMAEDYIHRIGRTGRAGRGGEAISLVSQDELGQLKGDRGADRPIPDRGDPGRVRAERQAEPPDPAGQQAGAKPARARGHANAKGKPAAGKGKGMAPRSRPSLRKTSPASGKWWARTSVSPPCAVCPRPSGATIRTTPTRSEAARALRPEQQKPPEGGFLCSGALNRRPRPCAAGDRACPGHPGERPVTSKPRCW